MNIFILDHRNPLIAVDVFHGPKRQVQLVMTVQQSGQFCLIPHPAD
jgi:hypothetical protein